MRVGGTAPNFLPMMVRARARRICWRNRAGPAGRPMSRESIPDPPRRPAMSLKPGPVDGWERDEEMVRDVRAALEAAQAEEKRRLSRERARRQAESKRQARWRHVPPEARAD